jgi:hypothetical protein
MSVPHFDCHEQSPIRAPVAQTSVQAKRKEYTTHCRLNWTLIAYGFSVKVRQRTQVDATKKYAS